jgi:hypothetical protein
MIDEDFANHLVTRLDEIITVLVSNVAFLKQLNLLKPRGMEESLMSVMEGIEVLIAEIKKEKRGV